MYLWGALWQSATLRHGIQGLGPGILQPAVVSAIIATLGTFVLPWVAGRARAFFQGRADEAISEAKRIERFYADVQEALAQAKNERDKAQEMNLQLRRDLIEWEIERRRWHDEKQRLQRELQLVAEDIQHMREIVEGVLDEHPELGTLGSLAARALERVRKGRRNLFEEAS